MHILTRVSSTPASALTIQIDAPEGGDGGFQGGGVFLFQPADAKGKPAADGGSHQVSDEAAVAIMSDPSLADHFTCEPPLTKKAVKEHVKEVEAAQEADAEAAVVAPAGTVATVEDEQPERTSGAAGKAKTKSKGK